MPAAVPSTNGAERGDASRARTPLVAGLGAFLLLAGIGSLGLLEQGHGLAAGVNRMLTEPWELAATWRVDSALVHGQAVHPAYGVSRWDNSYPLPYEILFAPFGALPAGAAAVLGRLLCIALLSASILAWSGFGKGSRLIAVPVLVSVPAVQLVYSDHVMSATGLAGLSFALLAHRKRRFGLAGVALAIGLVRPLNAVVVIAILLVSGWGRWRSMLALGAACAGTLAPLVAASFIVDPAWLSDYASNLSVYPMAGFTKVVVTEWHAAGLLALVAAGAAIAAALAWPPGGEIDRDRASLALALSMLIAPIEGLYSAVFTLPALLRVGQRASHRAVPWICSGLAWAAVAVLLPVRPELQLLQEPARSAGLGLLSALGLWMLFNTYPLIRGNSRSGGRGRAAGGEGLPAVR